MAPSRKKGARKAAAAAAARRQWKVGDLVLAKVKGFPAWPATVSEPEKWGYSSDGKKVLVYFFGTQQIAFCNPADVEAFTEEKKQSLAKRQGRGADFVRAVKEIIASYEKLKRDIQVQKTCSNDQVTNVDVSKPADSYANVKVQRDAPLTHDSQNKSSNLTDRQELVCAAENGPVVAIRGESCNNEVSLEEPTDDAVATATGNSPLPVTSPSPGRCKDLHLESHVLQRNEPVRRSRSSSRVHNIVVPCDAGGNAGEVTHIVPITRNKRIKKSPDLSGCDDADSSAYASDVSMEDNGSENIAVDSDSFSPNEGSTLDSDFKLGQSENSEWPEFEVELKKGLDLEIKAVFNKKKRKPNRKRANNDSATPSIRKEEPESQNANHSLQNMCGNSIEKCLNQDGDEHLPLSKRARVRMGKSSSEAELNSTVQAQEKSYKEDIVNSPKQIITSSNCENGSLAGEDPVALNGTVVLVSSSNLLEPHFESGSQICKTKKEKMFGCTMDVEAALPPSKRLHRALEAMSANAAVEDQACNEPLSSLLTSSGTSTKRCPCMTTNCSKGGTDLETQGLESCAIGCSHISVSSITTCSNAMISTENKSSSEVDKQLSKYQCHEACKDVVLDGVDQVGENLGDSVVDQGAKTDSQIQLHGNMSPNLDVKCCEVRSNQDSPGPSLPPKDEDNMKTVNHSNPSDTLELNGISVDPVAGPDESGKVIPQSSINVGENKVVCEDTQCSKQAIDEGSRIKNMHEAVRGVEIKGQEEYMNLTSISNGCLGENGTLCIQSSPSLTGGGGCVPQGSPPNTSVCNVSTSDSSNILQNGSCSPDVHQKNTSSGPIDGWKDGSVANQQSRLTGKSTDAGNAALLYFEAMLGTLTRTKESIGRATRIAMDCAKFGIAAKVMEILVRSLETESSLHRKVDLFFLVDSIAQSSRGLKGDGGAYPSAMQAVLSRLLSAAAPPGHTSQENRRQLWLERRILPESIIRRHIRELDTYHSSAGVYSRRTLRTERPLDDPVREMEGMLVDKYGSNSSFQLPGFCMPQMLKDEDEEGSDSDGGNFEAVTPEHDSEVHEVPEIAHAIEKHRRVLEDVDGELEMEDVAPSFDVESNSNCNVEGGDGDASQLKKNVQPSFVPPLPQEIVRDNMHHSMAEPMTAPRSSQPINDAVCYQDPEQRGMHMTVPEPSCSFKTSMAQPQHSFRYSDGATLQHNGYPLRPPQPVPSDQFSFVHGEQLKPPRDGPPPPPPPFHSHRHHFVQNMQRENFSSNHDRSKPPPYDYQERWNPPMPYSGPQYHDNGMHVPYGCHPCESTSLPGQGWRFPSQSMNHWDSMPYRPPYEDAVPVANRGFKIIMFQAQAIGDRDEHIFQEMMTDMTHFWHGIWLYIGGESKFITLYMQGKDNLSYDESLHRTKSYSIRLYIYVSPLLQNAAEQEVSFLEECTH
ncbi:hypothetical protein Ahy_A06g026549 isoform A [Arachis hypogaea]|uniref:PWWP domain-containing protein n=1 Tax=Arachis hypogaea TaxID=3818 RepID=A0A445CKW6_ARAHY|nr:hypothetical protein Ahy_A06g026549 isoform A [Arachis hypogaea]